MLCSPRTFHYLSRDWERRNRPSPLCGNWRVNALLPFGSWKRRQSRARELAATKAKMCLSLWRKATSAPQPTQVPVDFPVVPNVPLLRTPGPSFFPVSDHCPRGFFFSPTRRVGYFKTLLGVPSFSTSAAVHGLCPPIPQPRPLPRGLR